ncbi:MAG: hypothetical protein AAGE90_05205 [Pseudomonadota bacterium]
MTKLIAIPALAAVLSLATASSAGAWERHTTVTGPHGTASTSASGGCGGGFCSRSVTRVGPYGATSSRTVTRRVYHPYPYAGSVSRSVTRFGPYGGSVTRSVRVHR